MPSTKTPQKETKKAPAKAAPKTTVKSVTPKKSPAKTGTQKKTTKKPKNMAKVPVTTSSKATAELSAQLDKVPRGKTPKSTTNVDRGKTIADRTVALKSLNITRILSLLALLPLAGIWYLFTYRIMGYDFTALVCLCLMGLILFYNVMALIEKLLPNFAKGVTRIFTVILCVGLLIVGVTECLIIKASFGSPEEEVPYIVVLGAKVRPDGPSVSLQNRIDAAYDYLTRYPNTIAVVSGGHGDDEPMTEAQCMYDHLVAKGIDPGRIWMEDKATSTWENLHFTLDLIEEKTGARPVKLGVVSSEYHLFRASLFTKECGVEFVGIPAHTTRLSQMINHFMREVAGVWHYILLGGQYHD